MQKLSKRFSLFIVLVVVLGFISGVVGELWVNSFLLPSPYLNFKTYSDLSQKIDELVQKQSDNVELHERDVAIHETIQKVKPATVKIYRYKNFTVGGLDSLLPSDLLGQGAIITGDGWIVTNNNVVKSKNQKFWLVTNDHTLYETEEVVINETTGMSFIKIKANNLPVVAFNLRSDLVDGQSVFIFGYNSGVMSSTIKSRSYSGLNVFGDYSHSSEEFYKFIQLTESVSAEFVGSPVVTLDGKVAGFVEDDSGLVRPIDQLTSLMKQIVQGEDWDQPYLGVRFYDLAEVLSPLIKETKGAMVTKSGIGYQSPFLGLIEPMDIILKVEGEELSQNKNLPELMAQYKPGDTIKFVVKHGDEEREVEVKLKSR